MKEERAEIIAVDFDGTLCENKWPEIGEKNQEVIDYILAKQSDGAKLILWTNRCGEELDKAIVWCETKGIIFDAVNENLQSTIDFFGSDPRKVCADEYIDDKAVTRFRLPYKSGEKSDMEKWAEKEVELACKRENPDRGKDEWDYGCACYESALQAFKTLLKMHHSGYSISVTKNLLNRLIEGKPLTSIEDVTDTWNYIATDMNSAYKLYQCKRMSSLFKKVYSDGTVKYTDIDSCYGVYSDNPDSGSSFHSDPVQKIFEEMWPITMPYWPPTKPTKFLVREYLCDPKNGDFDTVAVLSAIRPNGANYTINRYFKEAEHGWEEIDEIEYQERINYDSNVKASK